MELSNQVNIPCDGKDQWWLLSVVAEFPTPDKDHKYRARELMDWVRKMEDIESYRRIIANPIISKDLPIDDWRSFRGHEDDPDPFIVRKKKLPVFRAQIESQRRIGIISFHSEYSRDCLTPGQIYWLRGRFEQQLIELHSMDLLKHLTEIAIENALTYNIRKMEELQRDLEFGMNVITDYRKDKLYAKVNKTNKK